MTDSLLNGHSGMKAITAAMDQKLPVWLIAYPAIPRHFLP